MAKKGEKMTAAQKEKLREAARRQWTPEARAKASADRKAAAAAKTGKSSSPSLNASPSSSVPTLPSPAAASDAPSEALLKTILERLEAPTTESDTPRLPEDDAGRDSALRPYRFTARIPVMLSDTLFQAFGLDGLSEEERKEGVNAFSVLFWEWGLLGSGKVLVFLWLAGVMIPRAPQAVQLYRASQEETRRARLEAVS